MGCLVRSTLTSKSDFAWTAKWGAGAVFGARPAAREAWRCCGALLGWTVPQAGLLRGPGGLAASSHALT